MMRIRMWNGTTNLKRWALALCCVGAGLSACDGEPEDALEVTRPVVIAEVQAVDVSERIAATGQLVAPSRAEVAAQVQGEITAVLRDEGATVEAGEVVLEIDPERFELELARARAGLSEARASLGEHERDVKRQRALAQRAVASKAQLDEAETAVQTSRSRVQAAQANLGVAERALRDSKVTARFSGQIGRRYLSVGEFVQPGQKLFELVAMDPIEVEFFLPERDSSRASIGQTLDVFVAPYPDQAFRATVTVVSPTIDSRTRTLRVKAVVENKEGKLKPGLFARADLGVADRKGVIIVPEEAVLQRADGPVVFRLVEDNRVERIVVELGKLSEGHAEIMAGLAVGDSVIRRGHDVLIDGSAISLRNPDGTPAVAAGPESALETTP
ncbi:MAG: efflux RND transporter periplasmic adaptor subunit [bacterium]|nr:efflux RND transporter periplasmic adaptor subunit [bacterium]